MLARYIFCEESKVGNWIVSHIFLCVVCFLIFFFLSIAFTRDVSVIWGLWWLVPLFLGLGALIRFVFRDMCSRVEVDTVTAKIKFFRFYHNAVETPVRSVEFRCGYRFARFYAEEKFAISPGYTNLIAEVLPEGVEIKFSDGFWGRLGKRQFEKRRRTKASGK